MNAAALGWDTLFFNGSIVDLNIKIWPARMSVRPSDLGIEDTKEVREALGLGVVRLAPKIAFDRLLAIRRAALKDVENLSFNFPFIRGARYVPEKNIETLSKKLQARLEEWNVAVAEFVEDYHRIRQDMMPIIRKALIDAACDNIDDSMNRVAAEYPAIIGDRFFMGWTTYAVSGAKNKAAAEGATQEAEQVKGIIREIVSQLRTEFTDKVASISKIIARGAKIPTTSIASAREVLARVKEMNVFGDVELSNQVRAFERILALSEMEDKSFNTVATTDLDAIAENIKNTMEAAVANAEASLTGMGNRRINL